MQKYQKSLFVIFFILYISFQTIQCSSQDDPSDQKRFHLVKRKQQEKSKEEEIFDLILTSGNENYQESYLELRKVGDQFKIIKRIFNNEINGADIRSLFDSDKEKYLEFDDLERKIFMIKVMNLLSHEDVNETQEQFEQKMEDLQKQIPSYQEGLNLHFFLEKGLEVGGFLSKSTVSQTFKIMNNALIQKGMKNFARIGGKQMMVTGKDIALKVLGKKILEGTVKSVMVEAGKKTALTVAATTFSPLKFIAGFGITMVIGAGIGGVKALIKSGWENQEVEIVNVNSDFNFSKLQEFENDFNAALIEIINQEQK